MNNSRNSTHQGKQQFSVTYLAEVVGHVFELRCEVHQHTRHFLEALVGSPVQCRVTIDITLIHIRSIFH